MDIRQQITLPASADKVYAALLSDAEFSAFTGAPAHIAAQEGGEFSCFGGQIVGRSVELLPDQRIVQAWRVAAWDAGVYSIVRFDLQTTGGETDLSLPHSGFPEDFRQHLEGGWHKMYWEPLARHLGS